MFFSSVQAIDAFKPATRAVSRPLRLPISDVFSRARGGVAIGGKLEAGALKVRLKRQPKC
jgi:elongation factor 1 alpha-like protein